MSVTTKYGTVNNDPQYTAVSMPQQERLLEVDDYQNYNGPTVHYGGSTWARVVEVACHVLLSACTLAMFAGGAYAIYQRVHSGDQS